MNGAPPPNGGFPPSPHEPQPPSRDIVWPMPAAPPAEAAPSGPRPPSPAALWVSASWLFHLVAVVLLPVTLLVGLFAYYLTVDTRAEPELASFFTWGLALVMGGPVLLSFVCGALGQVWRSSAWVRVFGIISLLLSALALLITAVILVALFTYR